MYSSLYEISLALKGLRPSREIRTPVASLELYEISLALKGLFPGLIDFMGLKPHAIDLIIWIKKLLRE